MNKSTAHTIEVENLKVQFETPGGIVDAVKGISFNLGKERLGIVGESGSGKSQTGRAILNLLDQNGKMSADRLSFNGIDLLNADEKTMREIRGKRISMIMQDPQYSLNPIMKVGEQISEAFLAHTKASKKEARQKALEMLATVQIRNPETVYHQYPHQVSGGMGQRIMIAMMLIPDPEVIIADEPTSALDVTIQLQVLSLIDEMVEERGAGLILISHDIHLVSTFCERVLVMYGGKIMESIPANELKNAEHPYTRGLLECMPGIDGKKRRLTTLKRDAAWLEYDSK